MEKRRRRGWVVVPSDYVYSSEYKLYETICFDKLYLVYRAALEAAMHGPRAVVMLAEVCNAPPQTGNHLYLLGQFELQIDPELKIWRSCTGDG